MYEPRFSGGQVRHLQKIAALSAAYPRNEVPFTVELRMEISQETITSASDIAFGNTIRTSF